ncbi:MAG: transcriptional repressor [Chloroflexi bacterium]|nr:transcriptional repressor [Chloroflexota bacterium]
MVAYKAVQADGDAVERSIALVGRRLHERGGRVTSQRLALARLVLTLERVLSPQELHGLAVERGIDAGLTTVYRTLDLLEELGLVTRVHGLDGCHGVAPRRLGHEHQLTCTACGKIAVIDRCDLGHEQAEVAAATGYKIEGHLVQYFGRCPDCRLSA